MKSDNEKFKNEFKKRLYNFVLRLIKLIRKVPKDIVFEIIIKQLLRSATSVLANYIEATSASSRRDFINFFTHSLKSANESKVWLTLLRDLKVGNPNELSWLINELVEISKIFATSIITLKGKKKF
ncbi:MAG: four helix bundle protein [Patescibacteria group bacterium]|nr:four helix bundle protein [Patescibacteria group bacterium]